MSNSKSNQSSSNLYALRHSTEHILTQAMHELYGEDKVIMAMGPATDTGFYFDFEPAKGFKLSEDMFPEIEAKMAKIIKQSIPITKEEISIKQARQLFANNPYKLEWLDEIEANNQPATIYRTGDKFVDLCAGPHVDNTSQIGAFKLLSIAGAYWHGDEKNKMLTRIYGTAFTTQKELDDFLWLREKAKKRDHKLIAKQQDLYMMSPEVGQGLTLWLPNGATIRREIENFMVKEQIKMGYQHVYSPHIGQKTLWKKSGHWDLYRDKMYSPMEVDKTEYLVKPMTCPMHIQTYAMHKRSYRDLPLKIAEIASVYRYEKSGELNGLLRVRAFTQDDAHIFCTQEQAVNEFLEVFHFIQKLYQSFGFKDYHVRLGIRSKKEKYLGNDQIWKTAEEKILQALDKSGSDYSISEGDAAFYGPKADFLVKDSLGREWQCGTVQIDFMLPERFNLKYIDKQGKTQTPVMIHRAPLGSLERFFAILIEHYAGAFPLWLAPVQLQLLTISENEKEYAHSVLNQLQQAEIRVKLDDSDKSLGKKISLAQKLKPPYIGIIGKQEVKDQTITIKNRQGEQLTLDLSNLISKFKQEIASKS